MPLQNVIMINVIPGSLWNLVDRKKENANLRLADRIKYNWDT